MPDNDNAEARVRGTVRTTAGHKDAGYQRQDREERCVLAKNDMNKGLI